MLKRLPFADDCWENFTPKPVSNPLNAPDRSTSRTRARVRLGPARRRVSTVARAATHMISV